MITTIRLAGIILLLVAEALLPDANMIILIATVAITGWFVIDQRREKIEQRIVYQALCKIKNEIRSAVSKPADR